MPLSAPSLRASGAHPGAPPLGALLLATLLLATVAAGCIQVNDSSPQRSLTCVNGACEVCVEGDCAPCQGQECQDCLDGTACPALDDPAEPAPAEPLDDVDIGQELDLSTGLAQTTWTFEVAAGATGRIWFTIRDLATREAVVNGQVCLEYEVLGPGRQSTGSQGSCSNNSNVVISVGGTTSDNPYPLLRWNPDTPGTYKFTAEGPPQGNELVVDIEVDNP